MSPDDERRARAMLSFLAQPGDPVLGAALRSSTGAEILAAITGTDADGQASGQSASQSAAVPGDLPMAGQARRCCPLWPGWRPGRTAGCG